MDTHSPHAPVYTAGLPVREDLYNSTELSPRPHRICFPSPRRDKDTDLYLYILVNSWFYTKKLHCRKRSNLYWTRQCFIKAYKNVYDLILYIHWQLFYFTIIWSVWKQQYCLTWILEAVDWFVSNTEVNMWNSGCCTVGRIISDQQTSKIQKTSVFVWKNNTFQLPQH